MTGVASKAGSYKIHGASDFSLSLSLGSLTLGRPAAMS